VIESYTTETCWHYPKTGHDAAGEPQFGASSPVACRVQHKQQLVRSEAGQTVVSQVQLFVGPSVAVAVRDRFRLPDNTMLPVILVRSLRTLDAPAYKMVLLGG
jgi:hypothetical protein